jgi:WD40 repeat protein
VRALTHQTTPINITTTTKVSDTLAQVQAILTFDGHTSNITGVAFHCESKWLVTSSEDGTVKIWDVVIHPTRG